VLLAETKQKLKLLAEKNNLCVHRIWKKSKTVPYLPKKIESGRKAVIAAKMYSSSVFNTYSLHVDNQNIFDHTLIKLQSGD
jgi:hypothetical protein